MKETGGRLSLAAAISCDDIILSRRMGQRTSCHLRSKISLSWVLRGQQHLSTTMDTSSPEAKGRTSKCSLKSDKAMTSIRSSKFERNDIDRNIDKMEKMHRLENERAASKHLEHLLANSERAKEPREKVKRAISEPSLVPRESTTPSAHEKHRHRSSKAKRSHKAKRTSSRFGYEITDLDSFLTKASIEKPANIPVVISFTSVLYQTQGGIQDEVSLPLGTVVNAVFKNQSWLYVQTPHGQEGYVGYSACLPLGILPQPTRGPCWETSDDVFPRPLGNMSDLDKLDDIRSECGGIGTSRRRRSSTTRSTISACDEGSVDRLYLRAAATARVGGSRQTLLIIQTDYTSHNKDSISVCKDDVVALLSDHVQDWFWVRTRDGREGFIPTVIAGNGFF